VLFVARSVWAIKKISVVFAMSYAFDASNYLDDALASF
jgi:hypothetical protein